MTSDSFLAPKSTSPAATQALEAATLVLMVKKPMLNQGKQRLAKTLGAHSALTIAQALLACAIEDLNAWPGKAVIACAHQQDIAWFKQLLPRAQVIDQGRGNLGERLNTVDALLRQQGEQTLLFIGSDAPTLNQDHYYSTVQALTRNDVVLNNAEDGGVVVMANKQAWPDLSLLPWSSSQLSSALAELTLSHNFSLGYARGSYDIDHQKELLRLQKDLISDTRLARQNLLRILNSTLSNPSNNNLDKKRDKIQDKKLKTRHKSRLKKSPH